MGSPQTGLHDPILKYLDERKVKINLSMGCRELVYGTNNDKSGRPNHLGNEL